MSPEAIASLGDATTVVIFVVFVIYWQKSQQASVKLNHEEWRSWFDNQNKQWRDGLEEIIRVFTTDATRRHEEATEERVRLRQTIEHLDSQIDKLITISQITYATIRGEREKAAELEKQLLD